MAICCLVAVLVYLPTLSYQLVWDDLDIVVQNQSSPFDAFSHSFWHGGGAGVLGDDPYYRPLANFSLGLDELVAGHRAWYFHMVNVMLHAVVVALSCLVVWKLFGSFWLTLVAGMLTAVHPLAADSVAYVSGRTDLLAAAGLLVAFLGLLRLRRQHDWLSIVMIWSGFAAGVLSKETGVMFAAVALVWVLVPGFNRVFRKDWIALAGMLALLGAYLLARKAVLGSVIGMSVGGSLGALLILLLNNFGRLLVTYILPWGQAVFTWAQVGPRLSLFAVASVLYFLLPVLLRRKHGWSEVGLAWFWGLALLLPFAGLAGYGPTGRLLYVPSIGLVSLLLFAGRERTQGYRGGRTGSVVVALAYCVLLALFALPQRMRAWRDGFTLFRQMTREAPQYPAGHFNLAFELRGRGDIDGAIAEYRKAIALDPTMALTYSNLGALLQSRGQLAEAESLYLKTIELRPRYALAWNNLGIIRYKRGDGNAAVQAFRRAMELKPDDAGTVYNLGRLYQQAGIVDTAAMLFERAYRLEPGNPQIRASYEQTRGGGQ